MPKFTVMINFCGMTKKKGFFPLKKLAYKTNFSEYEIYDSVSSPGR